MYQLSREQGLLLVMQTVREGSPAWNSGLRFHFHFFFLLRHSLSLSSTVREGSPAWNSGLRFYIALHNTIFLCIWDGWINTEIQI